jgi:hypothetical protein
VWVREKVDSFFILAAQRKHVGDTPQCTPCVHALDYEEVRVSLWLGQRRGAEKSRGFGIKFCPMHGRPGITGRWPQLKSTQLEVVALSTSR